MAANIAPLTYETHGKIKLNKPNSFPMANNEQLIPLVVHEIPSAALEFPVVFVKDTSHDQFRLAALCGLKPDQNLFCSSERWDGLYVPSILWQPPLSLAATGEADNSMLICIDENSPLIADSHNENNAESLFDDSGEQSEYLKKRTDSLLEFNKNAAITGEFIAYLNRHELLKDNSLKVDIENEKYNITGLFCIDEEKLNQLPVETFSEMRKRGYLPAIYAHLVSLKQVNRLTREIYRRK